ncbi:MAG: hypothetical protein JNJ80_09320 [Gemmatimonadetes bacterium]|nr:hypothetical protein [Gemmatimonadota bacterium]MCC7133813.1 hypothetical protein [Gemmatimonadales bacterium]
MTETVARTLPVLAVLAGALAGPVLAQTEPVPVEREPSHRTVLENRYLQAFRVQLAPGQVSLMHRHSRDDAAVRLNAATTRNEDLGQPPGPEQAVVVGTVSARNNEKTPAIHRVHNVGTTQFDVLDVQALERPEGAEAPALGPVAAENPRMRVYRYDLEAGAGTAEHVHTRPFLLVAVTPLTLTVAGASREQFKPGDMRWMERPVTHVLTNGGGARGIVVEIEFK